MVTAAQETTLQEWEARALETSRQRHANARNQALKDLEEDSAKQRKGHHPLKTLWQRQPFPN